MALFKRDESMPDAAPAASGAPPSPTPRPKPGNPRDADGGTSDVANIGKSISIKGDLTGNEDISVEGKVDGKVDLPNNQLTIGANGVVHAEIKAKHVVVIGHVSGNVKGLERIEIQATGVVDGDVTAPRLVVAEGAVINGSIHMSQQEGGASPAAPKTAGSDGAPPVRQTA